MECWGDNTYGQLNGDGGSAYEVFTGDAFTCTHSSSGTIACWGRNHVGQASPPGGSWEKVSTGYLSGCALSSSGSISCWGMTDPAPAGTYMDVSAGSRQSCALTTDGSPTCWESGTTASSVDGAEPSGVFTKIISGGQHACVLDESGSIECWGDDSSGQVSDTRAVPTRISLRAPNPPAPSMTTVRSPAGVTTATAWSRTHPELSPLQVCCGGLSRAPMQPAS